MGDLVKNLVIWTVIAVVIMSLFTGVGGRNTASQEFNYTDLFFKNSTTAAVSPIKNKELEIYKKFSERMSVYMKNKNSDFSTKLLMFQNYLSISIDSNLASKKIEDNDDDIKNVQNDIISIINEWNDEIKNKKYENIGNIYTSATTEDNGEYIKIIFIIFTLMMISQIFDSDIILDKVIYNIISRILLKMS
mgnify:CR=1 FL=1